ncbi:MAG: glycosyltransferase family 2 protein [Lachnospiraceae bacterium]|nr:glycosyltransferase family 2 protein [Lachnospiraceae bacterium]
MEERTAPLISLVIPVYNAESTLVSAVNSVLGQPNADVMELLLVDDGSKDRSPQICDELAQAHPGIRVFHKENGGVSSARNMGIEQASGKYIAFLDSDDWWEPGFLTDDLVEQFAGAESADLYCFSCQRVSPNKKWVKPLRVRKETFRYDTPDNAHNIEQSHSAFLIRREYLSEMGFRFLPTKVWEDITFTQLCCTFARSITCIDKIIFSYWMNNDSAMHTKSGEEKFMEFYKVEHMVRSIFHDHGLPYDIDSVILSIIVECLKYISEESSYGHVKKLLEKEEFSLLKRTDLQPWGFLQKDAELWRKKPFLAYAKYKFLRAPVRWFKRILLAIPFTRPIAEFLQYRVIEKWEPMTAPVPQ